MSKHWSDCEALPSKLRINNTPIVIHDNEILITPPKYSSSALYKYGIKQNEWIKWIEYPPILQDIDGITSTINSERNKIFIYSQQNNIMKLNMESLKFKIIHNTVPIGHSAVATFINDDIHIIGGCGNTKHLVFSPKNNQFEEIYNFSNNYQMYCTSAAMIHIPSKKSILFMGGFDGTKWSDNIYSFDINHKLWKKLDICLPFKMHCFGHILSKNEQYLIIFGGYTSIHQSQEIHILHLDDMKFSQSSVNCPESGKCFAVNICNEEYKELIILGYLRKLWKLEEFCNIKYPSNDIIDLFKEWFCYEWIYLFFMNYHSRIPYKINLDDIINPDIQI